MRKTPYQLRTATARRRTEARIEEVRHQRAENRRLYGIAEDPLLRYERQAAGFPGFPPLTPSYPAPPGLQDGLTTGSPAWSAALSIKLSLHHLAVTRDLAARSMR